MQCGLRRHIMKHIVAYDICFHEIEDLGTKGIG